MASFELPNVDGLESIEQLKNVVGKMTKELGWLLNNLDTKNMNEIDGDILVTGTVTAGKINVNELSAISANLGHITAGLIEAVQIFGSYIATRQNAYPRCEMSATGNVFAAYLNAANYIAIEPNYGGAPSLTFWQGGSLKGRMHTILGYPEFQSLSSMNIEAAGTMFLNSPRIQLADWSNLYSNRLGRTLADDLTEIFLRLEALEDGP
ncbi:hypothetical protein MKZ12_07320 [Paenibacillus sp. FSL R5-0713]|uniref:hypothetical protein n=1 Tax=Paenibacillus sp. FSL R5-0713 TaxID=2921655 RepID=UPI0030DC3AF9